MIRIHQLIYLGGIALWAAYVLSSAHWQGRFYNPVAIDSSHHVQAGVFGLRGPSVRPVWSPPVPHSDSIRASVRLPWQSPSERAHVEIDGVAFMGRLSIGIIFLGLVSTVYCRVKFKGITGLVDSLASALSLCLFLCWIGLLALAGFSMGLALTDSVVYGATALGIIAGLTCGAWRFALREPNQNPAPTSLRQSLHWPALWFVTGILLGFVITWIGGAISLHVRGPSVGAWELGTPRYNGDQTPIALATAMGIVATGWCVGLVSLRQKWSRTFAVGLIATTTLLGLIVAISS